MADERPKGRDGFLITISVFVPVPPRDMAKAVEAGRVIERLRHFRMRDGDEKHFEVIASDECYHEDYVVDGAQK